jgi:hypothetical protein
VLCKQRNMRDLKKVTVRFFLHRGVQAGSITKEDGKETPVYPLYLYVTYNRKNMQFKSNYGMVYADLDDVEKTNRGLMAFEEKLITKIIRYETSLLPNEDIYDMKGLKDKYEVYATSVKKALEVYLTPKLRLSVLKTNNELQHVLNFNTDYYHNTVLRLYKAAGMLFDNFYQVLDEKLHEELEAYQQYSNILPKEENYNFPAIIDWLDGSYKSELNAFLEKLFKRKQALISSIENLINSAIEKKIREIKKIDQKYLQSQAFKNKGKQ